jgi:hypothetical protein
VQKPANTRLWNTLVVQAKAKYGKWPSIPAAKWVHDQYVRRGGQFLDSDKDKRMQAIRSNKPSVKKSDDKGKKDNKS